MGCNYDGNLREIIPYNFPRAFTKHFLIRNIFGYLGIFVYANIFYAIEKRKIRDVKRKSSNLINTTRNISNFIYLDLNKMKKEYNSCLRVYLIIFIWIFEEYAFEFFWLFQNLDVWMIELIILAYMNSKTFGTQLFNHQKLAIWLNLIPMILKIITIYFAFHYETDSSESEYKDEFGLKIIYLVHEWLIAIAIPFYLILITLRSYVGCKIKLLTDLGFISENKLLVIYGFIGFILSLSSCLILNYIKCGETNLVEVSHYFCSVDYENYKYYDSFYQYFNSFEEWWEILIEIILILLSQVIFFFYGYYKLKVIKYFSAVHEKFSIPITYITEKTLFIINTIIFEGTIFKDDTGYHKNKLILDFLGDIMSISFFSIYLEVIEFKCCKLDLNSRANIIKRGEEEIYEIGPLNENEEDDVSSDYISKYDDTKSNE